MNNICRRLISLSLAVILCGASIFCAGGSKNAPAAQAADSSKKVILTFSGKSIDFFNTGFSEAIRIFGKPSYYQNNGDVAVYKKGRTVIKLTATHEKTAPDHCGMDVKIYDRNARFCGIATGAGFKTAISILKKEFGRGKNVVQYKVKNKRGYVMLNSSTPVVFQIKNGKVARITGWHS